MFNSYFKIAWRSLIKNKSHSFINIAGLSFGIACSLLIFLWVQNEISIDGFHTNGKRLYKVFEREFYKDYIDGNYDTPGPLANELKRGISEVEDAVTMQDENAQTTLQAGDKIIKVKGTGAGAGLFGMFSYPLLQGTPTTALSSITSMAISEKTAKAFFGSAQNAMGKIVLFNNKRDFKITAVYKDLPANASRTFDYVISWEALQQDQPWLKEWGNG